MSVSISPVALATTALVANQVSLLVAYNEKLCRGYDTHTNTVPQVAVSYTYGTPVLNDSTVFVPVTASITIATPGKCNCGTPTMVSETFMVAFQGQTALPTAVTITLVGRTGGVSSVSRCGIARSYTIDDSLTVAITPPTTTTTTTTTTT